jgi:SHO1 osmosensor
MPPRGNSESLDVTPILTHYLFLFTSILAILAWFVAFISQAVATAQFGHANVGVLWFAIFLQLFLVLGVLYTLASDSIAMHRFQISVFGAITIVFAVIGVDQGIFTGLPSLEAMAAGWLVLSIVDILWVLYFTSEEDSLMLHVFNLMGNGGLTPPSRRRRTTRTQSVHNNGYAAHYAGGGIGSHDAPYDSKTGGLGSGLGSGGMGVRSQHSFGGGASLEGPAATRSLGGNTGAGSMHNTPLSGTGVLDSNSNLGPNSPLIGPGAAGVGAGVAMSGNGSGSPPDGPDNVSDAIQEPESYAYKAKALYAYSASTDDPNEISFTKGEILDIVDKQGKWWQAKNFDGKIGIAPSNYLQII